MALVLGTNCGFVTERPTADPSGTNGVSAKNAIAISHTSPAGATKVTEIGWWGENFSSTNYVYYVGIYSDDGGSPSRPYQLLGSASAGDGTDTSSKWVYTSTDIDISPNTKYWIAVYSGDQNMNWNYSTITGGARDYMADPGSLPSTWSSTNTLTTAVRAFYAVYTSGAATGTNFQINVGDSWKTVTDVLVNVGDAWKTVTAASVNVGDTWKTIF